MFQPDLVGRKLVPVIVPDRPGFKACHVESGAGFLEAGHDDKIPLDRSQSGINE